MATPPIPSGPRSAGSNPSAEKALRSKKLYWVLGTTAVAVALLALYYSLYVSSQQAYYNDRAFRLLSTMGDKVVMDMSIIGDVLAAAGSQPTKEESDEYAEQTMHGVWGPGDFEVTDLPKQKKCPTHDGNLTLGETDHPAGFRVQATYEENGSAASANSTQNRRCPDASAPLKISAKLNLDPLVRPSLQALSEDFFDDVWIADLSGKVWFQQNQGGTRVQSLRALLASQPGASSWLSFSKAAPADGSSPADTAKGSSAHLLGQFSQERDIVLAGSQYKLFLQPLPLTIKVGTEEQRLVLCGLRSAERAQAQALALPYTYLIWGILATLAAFAVSWPFLKLMFMSPKERLRGRQLFYLAFSIVLATASLTLIALNVSYAVTSGDASQAELRHLAETIKTNMKTELRSALETLGALSADKTLLAFSKSDDHWNQAKFLDTYGPCFLTPSKGCPLDSHSLSYPYFRYFFLTDDKGVQQLKFTVNATPTPQVNVHREAYFHPVTDCQLSSLPKGDSGGGNYEFVMQPLYSPNTGEFLVALAAPYTLPCVTDPTPPKSNFRVKLLGIKFESLFKPLLPLGYGFAVVDSQGKVLFHSDAVRNLAEDFTKESQDDPTLQALLAEGTSDGLSTRYLGAQKQLWVTPIEDLGNLRLTLIVFKDTKYFTTVNAAVVIVFSLLLGFYAIFLFAGILIHMYRMREYPLQSIWPDPALGGHYLHIILANTFLISAFFWRYGAYQMDTTLWAVTALVLTAPLCAFFERSSRRGLILANLLVLGVLFGLSGATWVIVHPLLYAVIVFHPRFPRWQDWVVRHFKLDYNYTLMTASVLLILVVAPCCGFFKVSYDFVQRLFLQREQLDVAEKLQQRQDAIEDYYVHHAKAAPERAKQFAALREQLDWDRYDRVFLNPEPKGSLVEETTLRPNRLERAVAELTGWFPSNALGAELRELARGTTPAGRDWCVRRYSTEKRKDAPFLALSGAGEPVVSAVRGWPALDPRVRIPVGITIVILIVWMHFVHGRIFLCSLASIPTLPKWRPEESGSQQQGHNLLIIAHPKSGKRSAVKRVEGVHFVDLASLVTRSDWNIGEVPEDVIALSHFEFDIDNPDTNLKKLHLLEDLIYVQHKRIILLSTIDPMFYLSAGSPDVIVPGNEKELGTAIQLLDRWAAALAHFTKLTIDDVTQAGFREVVKCVLVRHPDPAFKDFVRRVVEECDHTAQLRIMGAAILIAHVPDSSLRDAATGSPQTTLQAVRECRSDSSYQDFAGWVIQEYAHKAPRQKMEAAAQSPRGGEALSKEALVQELLDRGDAYYRVLWSTCTRDERLVLYQLAKDGWANPKNELATQQLQRRNLVIKSPGLRLMNVSFRHFILDAQYRDEIANWQQEGDQSLWRSLRMSLGILGVAVAAWLLYSQQQFFNTVVAYVGAIGGATGVIIKLVSELRGGKATGGQ